MYATIDQLHIALSEPDTLIVRLKAEFVHILFVVTRGRFRVGNNSASNERNEKHWPRRGALIRKHMRAASGAVLLADANASVHSIDALDIEHSVPFRNFLCENPYVLLIPMSA